MMAFRWFSAIGIAVCSFMLGYNVHSMVFQVKKNQLIIRLKKPLEQWDAFLHQRFPADDLHVLMDEFTEYIEKEKRK